MKLVIIGIMMVMLTGVVVGLLLAPNTGSEMRSRLKEKAEPIIRFRDRRRGEAA